MSRNALVFKKWLNQQRNHSFSASRAAFTNSNLAVVDVDDGRAARSRISRMNRVDAQNALFDTSTVPAAFVSQYISKNSPMFLQGLLGKIEDDHDVGRSVTKFLHYNPINEFEPFFESLGLKPSELFPLLPHNLMFLSDDDVLLEN